jgi:hypothetical protein
MLQSGSMNIRSRLILFLEMQAWNADESERFV